MAATHPYNTAPDGWTELTEAEFARSIFFHYDWDRKEHRQFLVPYKDREHYHSVQLFHFWNQTGIGLTSENADGKVRYFRFGCNHQMTRDGRTDKCTLCDFSHPRIDSSD